MKDYPFCDLGKSHFYAVIFKLCGHRPRCSSHELYTEKEMAEDDIAKAGQPVFITEGMCFLRSHFLFSSRKKNYVYHLTLSLSSGCLIL